MKTSACFGIAIAALAITVEVSPAHAFLWGLTADPSCSEDWPTWKKVADPAAYAIWTQTCLETSGTGSDENLRRSGQGSKRGQPGFGYGSDPKSGFGTEIPVTLPPDRHPPKGTDTGIPVRGGNGGPVFQPQRYPIQPPYFRPR